MNISTVSLSSQLNQMQILIGRYFLVPIYIIGNLGNIANIILFSKRSLRLNNVCAWYFIGISLANLVGLNIGGLTRILSLLNNFTLESTSVGFCRFRQYFAQSAAAVGRYFLCLISIDRWMITSSNDAIRRMSSSKIARNLIIFGVTAIAAFDIHVAIGFQIKNSRCFAYLNDDYAIFFNVYNIIIIFLPILIMILFSIFTLFNIRQSRSRVAPNTTQVSVAQKATMRSNRQRDMQFIRLAIGQVLLFSIFIVQYGIYNLYDLLTSSQIKNADRRTIESFISGIVIDFNYVSISITFFSYTLTSNTFRKEFGETAHRVYTIIRRRFAW